jgi:hypothetical protein
MSAPMVRLSTPGPSAFEAEECENNDCTGCPWCDARDQAGLALEEEGAQAIRTRAGGPLMDPAVTDDARELVLLSRANDVGYARIEVGTITVQLNEHRSTPRVTVNWPGCGGKTHTEAAAVASDLARASEIALATEQLIAAKGLVKARARARPIAGPLKACFPLARPPAPRGGRGFGDRWQAYQTALARHGAAHNAPCDDRTVRLLTMGPAAGRYSTGSGNGEAPAFASRCEESGWGHHTIPYSNRFAGSTALRWTACTDHP